MPHFPASALTGAETPPLIVHFPPRHPKFFPLDAETTLAFGHEALGVLLGLFK